MCVITLQGTRGYCVSPRCNLATDAVPGGQRCSPECGTCVASSWPAAKSEEKVLGLVGSDPTQQGWKWFSWMETLVKFRQDLIAGCGTTSWFLTHSSMVHHWLDLNLNDDSMTLDLLYHYSFLWFHSRTHTFPLDFLAKNACIFSSTNHLIISLSYTELKKMVRWIFGPWVTSGDFWGGGPLLPRTPYWSTNTLQQIGARATGKCSHVVVTSKDDFMLWLL